MADTKNKIKQLVSYIKRNPNDSFSKFALALEFLKMDKTDKARILFENIRDKDPDYIGVYYHLGNLYATTGAPEKARSTFKTGIEKARKANESHAASELQEALFSLELEEE